LRRFCDRARAEGAFALDLEFQRERTFWAKLCLIQVATRTESRIVDPLSRDADVTPIVELVADPSVETILHSGGQDMEILHRLSRRLPKNVFDTQIAAALLGMGEQIGYAALVERLCGVKLDKLETLTDWSRRPLTQAQVTYALDDVRHLFAVRDALKSELDARGRSSWAVEENAFYEAIDTYESDPREAWMRITRTRGLAGRGLAILREVAAWREETAQEDDEPRGRLATDDILVEIARRTPRSARDLGAIRGLHPNVIGRYGDAIVAAVERGAAVPEREWPAPASGRMDDPHAAVLLDFLEVVLRWRAARAEIAPSYVGSRRDLAELLEFERRAGPSVPVVEPPSLLCGWRRELAGDEILAALRGEAQLFVDPATSRVESRRSS
jgi:ribonuclease D